MDIKELEKQVRKDFNNAICVVGLCHMWVFAYLVVGEVASRRILTREGMLIMIITMGLLLVGIASARKILWTVIKRLFNFNQQILKLQEELIEKSRLAAITETTLTLSHEINNPLMIMRGNLEMLEDDFVKGGTPAHAKERVAKIKNHCERIRQITDKLTNLSRPVDTTIHGDKKMIDTDKSE